MPEFPALELAKQFCETTRVVRWREDDYVYGGGSYQRLDREGLPKAVFDFLDAEWGAVNGTNVHAVVQFVRWLCHVPDVVSQPVLLSTRQPVEAIVCRNGVLRIDATGGFTLVEHDDDLFTTASVDYEYDRNAQCPQWQEFVSWMCSGNAEEVRLIHQFAAWSLIARRLRLQKCLWTFGYGANGKSTALLVLRHVLGETATAAVGLGALTSESGDFRHSPLLNAIANFCCETNIRKEQPLAALNAWISGDPKPFNRKHKEFLTFKPHTILFFASNALPIFNDPSEAWWRRLMLIRCRQRASDEDPVLEDRLKLEAPGILNMLLEQLPGLIARGAFEIPASVAANVGECKLLVNSARLFLSAKVVQEDPDDFIAGSDLMSFYQGWCEQNGYRDVDLGVMKDEVLRTFGVEYKRQRVVGFRVEKPYGWLGIRLSKGDEIQEGTAVVSVNRAHKLEADVADLQRQLKKAQDDRKQEVDDLRRQLAAQEAELNGLRPACKNEIEKTEIEQCLEKLDTEAVLTSPDRLDAERDAMVTRIIAESKRKTESRRRVTHE